MGDKAVSPREFRQDINGLRAWAVMAVVLYHFDVTGLSGGFAGVDVFFVISGYLMCGIIVRGLEDKRFNLWGFYLSRAKRIWPALFVLCVVMLAFGWFWLMPREYSQLGQHARESLLFSSNLRYLSESGYFDVASQEKWLLHTWSLAVEWQFYLLLPLLCLLCWRFLPGRKSLAVLLGSIFVGSLAWCIWLTTVAPNDAFYTLQSRAWEMLAGALVFLIALPAWSDQIRRILELAGFALILLSVALLDTRQDWPGWRALLPVAGAVLVLLAARNQSFWTSCAPAQWLGTRSYSIYLWHWPLVVALAYCELLNHSLWVTLAIIASLVLGHLSYRLVEIPAQRWLGQSSAKSAAVVLIALLVIVVVSAQAIRRDGFPQRLPEQLAFIADEKENTNPRIEECLARTAHCIYGEEPVRAIVIGDSHADAVVTAVEAALPNGGGVLFRGASGCLIAFNYRSYAQDKVSCEKLNNAIEQEYLSYPEGVPIIYVGRFSEHIHGGLSAEAQPKFYFSEPSQGFTKAFLDEFSERYIDTLCRLAEHHPVYVARPIPEMPFDVPTRLGRSILLGVQTEQSLPLNEYHHRHAYIWRVQDQAVERCGVKILDPLPYFCASGACLGVENGRPLYRDDDHLSEFGNRRLIPMFKEVFAPAD